MIEEILSKDSKKWKWKECDELINSSETSDEVKQQAKQRKSDIKEWLDKKKQSEQSGESAGKKAVEKEMLHLQDLNLSTGALAVISDEVKNGIEPLLARYYYIQSVCLQKGISHPATVGMFFNQYMENQRTKYLGGGNTDEP